MGAKHLGVGRESVPGKVHGSDHLSRWALEEESTAAVEDSVTSEDGPVHLPRHLGTLRRHLYYVLHAFDGALLWLNEVAYGAAGVAGRMMARDLHIVNRDYISIRNALCRINHIALVTITLSRLVVLSSAYDMDARIEASHLCIAQRVIIVLMSSKDDIWCNLDSVSRHEIDEFLWLSRVYDDAWGILQVTSDIVTQVHHVAHHRYHVYLHALIT